MIEKTPYNFNAALRKDRSITHRIADPVVQQITYSLNSINDNSSTILEKGYTIDNCVQLYPMKTKYLEYSFEIAPL